VNFRFDLYKEFTNSDDTTYYQQNIFGDIWTNVAYSRGLIRKNGWSTGVSAVARFLFPTSLTSQAAGVITTAGGGAALNQGIPINRGSEWFPSARLSLSGFYTHPFVRSTTAQNEELVNIPRTTINGVTGQSNQLSGGFLTEHQVLSVFDSGMQITPKLGMTLDMIFIQQWRYAPSNKFDAPGCDGIAVKVQNGIACATPGVANTSPQRYRLLSYFLASVDYQLTDELNVELGYYNFGLQLGPDGERRNPLWSPQNSRVYLSANISLDTLYERIRGAADADAPTEKGNIVSRNRVANPMLGQF
jgi:hypothetical protein